MPSAWQVVKTITRGNGGETGCVQLADPMCPSVTRYYIVPGALPDLYQQARTALVQSGFGEIEDHSPNCDALTYGGPLCSLLTTKDDVLIQISLYPSDQNVDGLGIATPGQPTVRIIAEHR